MKRIFNIIIPTITAISSAAMAQQAYYKNPDALKKDSCPSHTAVCPVAWQGSRVRMARVHWAPAYDSMTPDPFHNAYHADFNAGIIANAMVGGDNCHRGAVVGSLLGAANGVPAK